MRAGRQGGVVVSPTAGMKPPPLEQTDPVGAELKRMLDERAAEEAKPLALGIHFGLDAERYHRDRGIGSSGIRKLTRNPTDYWCDSWMNPDREDRTTPGLQRGSALHTFLFDGEDRFHGRYVCGPDQTGMTTNEKTQSTRKANEEAALLRKICLKRADYNRIVMARHIIMLNPALATAFTNGMPEVSVIYERDGIRCKARYDYLKTRGVGDLKGCVNQRGRYFPKACIADIENYFYPEQASWYLAARAEIPKMIAAGAVYGDHDPAWLKRVAASSEWAWQWVFLQMSRSPITWTRKVSPQNPLLESARAANQRGLENYKQFLSEHGTNMWVTKEDEPKELFIEDLSPWY